MAATTKVCREGWAVGRMDIWRKEGWTEGRINIGWWTLGGKVRGQRKGWTEGGMDRQKDGQRAVWTSLPLSILPSVHHSLCPHRPYSHIPLYIPLSAHSCLCPSFPLLTPPSIHADGRIDRGRDVQTALSIPPSDHPSPVQCPPSYMFILPSAHPSLYLSLPLSILFPNHPFLCPSLPLSIYPSISMSILLSIRPSLCSSLSLSMPSYIIMSILPSVHSTLCPFLCLSTLPSVHPSLHAYRGMDRGRNGREGGMDIPPSVNPSYLMFKCCHLFASLKNYNV